MLTDDECRSRLDEELQKRGETDLRKCFVSFGHGDEAEVLLDGHFTVPWLEALLVVMKERVA